MGKSKAVVLNINITMIHQICSVLFGLIVPRYFLVEYGADIHGLTSMITNILNYVVLLNAGLLTASVQALYKPLSTGNKTEINAVMNAVRKYYHKVGFFYSAAVGGLAVLLALFVPSAVPAGTIFALMLVMGLSNILDSFLGAKYRILVQADQKYWIMGLINTLSLIVRGILQLILIKCHMSIIIVQIVPALMTIMTYIFLKIYTYQNYRYLDSSITPQYHALNQRTFALVHQIAGVVVNNTDTILLTVFTNLTMVSIYSVYQMVFTHLYSLVANVFSTSIVASFGHMLVTDSLEKTRKIFDIYETFFYFGISCILATSSVLIGPFVNIYTAGIQGIKYYDLKLIFLFMIIAVLNNARVPCGMLINAAGHYKATQWRAVAEAAINLLSSLYLVGKLGIYGVLIGTVISFLYRTTDIIVYTNRHILKQSFFKSLRRVFQMVVTIVLVWNIFEHFVHAEITTWTSWILWGIITFLVSAVLSAIIWIIVDYKSFKQVLLFCR